MVRNTSPKLVLSCADRKSLANFVVLLTTIDKRVEARKDSSEKRKPSKHKPSDYGLTVRGPFSFNQWNTYDRHHCFNLA